MKIASVADVKARLSAYLKESQEGPVIVTRNGKAVAVLLAVTDEDELERLVLAHSPKFQALLEKSRRQIEETGGIPHDVFWRGVKAESTSTEKATRTPNQAPRLTEAVFRLSGVQRSTSVLPIPVSLLKRCRIDHVREAVAVAVLEIFQVQPVGLAHVGQGERDDVLAADVLDRPLDLARHVEEPFRVETLPAGVHTLHNEMLRNAAVAVQVAGELVRLVKDQAFEEAHHLAALRFPQGGIGPARRQRLAAVTPDDAIEIETGPVMTVGCRRAHAP